MKYNVELTDTFAGEANYCWVKRASFEAPADARNATLMRKAKALVGMSGVRGVTTSTGDDIEFRPYGMAQVMFVSPDGQP